ncbi:transglycosylase SLT domain-containing protein [Nisaea nitritireducens]|uniref:transglycosylase SLT domain-containing protein n=1 Tax=Nisaea nitritireducens TaxID=568392 RepID=UPI001869163E|nr:transglycosylase SLT domain-containing protein [Nisaea nitritireducens]
MRYLSMPIIFAATVIATLGLLAAPRAHALGPSDKICANATRHAEEEHRLPKHLLFAISLKETGRWNDERKESYTWPWTVTSGGKGRHYPTVFAAMAEVRRLLATGTTNIDVGCMQINLRYHGTAFEDLAEAFDPLKNTDYAARFLTELKERHGSWRDATEHYHSGNSVRGKNYRDAVSKLQQKAYRGETVTMADPSTDNLTLASAAADRADDLTAKALARKEQQAHEQAMRDERAERQREIAEERALELRQEFEDRKTRLLAAWKKRKAERRAKSGIIALAD